MARLAENILTEEEITAIQKGWVDMNGFELRKVRLEILPKEKT